MNDLSELDGLDLSSLDKKGKPTVSRLRDVKSANAIFLTLWKANEKSAINQSRIDAMFDGAAPYDAAQLAASGQSMKTNLNFGEAQRLLDVSLSAYVDLYSSLERLVEVRAASGEQNEAVVKEDVVGEELTNLFRSWPEFHSSYLRLCTTFLKHGVGITYFDSPEEWKFRVTGFSDLLIPRQTPATEEEIDIAVGRRQYHLHELYNFIRNEDAATKVGWNVDEVKRVMSENVRTAGRVDDYESLQAEFKNNDIHAGIQNPTVEVLHFWVRELDGTVSHFISAKDDPKDFLYKKVSRYSSPEQAYIIFSFGVGSNGTYHSVRGLGQRIFNHIQTSNRLRCQQIDGAMLASSVLLQPENNRALEELSFTTYGPYSVLSPNIKIIEKALPDLTRSVIPALQDITHQLQQNTDTVSSYGPDKSSPYRNEMQVVSDIDVSTRLSGASLNLFYASWNRLMREMVRRVVTTKKRDLRVTDFFKRCAARGVEEDFIKRMDVTRTKAVRSIGNGSMANRLVALRELQQISGQFDDVGRRNLTRDIVSTRVGHDLADRYAPVLDQERPTVDDKIAFFENQQLFNGQPVPVISNELHSKHLAVHMPAMQQLIEAYNAGTMEPQQLLPIVAALYEHIAQTIAFTAADPALATVTAQAKQQLQYAEEIINNLTKASEAANREDAPEQQQQQQVDPAYEKHLLQLKIAQEKADMDMAIKAKQFEQDRSLRDAKAALSFREEGANAL